MCAALLCLCASCLCIHCSDALCHLDMTEDVDITDYNDGLSSGFFYVEQW